MTEYTETVKYSYRQHNLKTATNQIRFKFERVANLNDFCKSNLFSNVLQCIYMCDGEKINKILFLNKKFNKIKILHFCKNDLSSLYNISLSLTIAVQKKLYL